MWSRIEVRVDQTETAREFFAGLRRRGPVGAARCKGLGVAGLAIITEACIGVKDRACVDVCPVQCIYEFDPVNNVLVSEVEAGSGIVENSHRPNPEAVAIFGDSLLYVNLDECTSCTACYQPDVCPVGAIYSDEHLPDGSSAIKYNSNDPNTGHDHRFFLELSRTAFAD